MAANEAGSGQAADERVEKILQRMRETASDASQLCGIYDSWSGDYELDVTSINSGYTHPQQIARIAAQHLPDRQCRLLDLCAGTGLGGQALQAVGFTNIDAIDGSSGMLDVARSKKVYKNLFHELIHQDGIKSFPNKSYAAVISSGSFVPGHLGPQHLGPILAAIKDGGLFIMAMRESWLQHEQLQQLEPEMQLMQQQGLWQLVESGVMPNYHGNHNGRYYVYRRL